MPINERDRRSELLQLLRQAGRALSVAEVATAAGLHPNTVRAHLAVLVVHGSVHRQTEVRTVPGRPRELYQAAPDGVAMLADALAQQLAKVASGDTAAIAAGREWAKTLDMPSSGHGLTALRQVLTRLGFAPELEADAVHLHACPFRDLAARHPSVVCNVHLGLIRGTLERTAPTVTATEIQPFLADGCRATLARAPSVPGQ